MISKNSLAVIACACHQANKAVCEWSGDHSQKDWNEAEDWQHESAIKGVQTVLENPDITAEELHEDWMSVKEKDGWVHGKVKDADKKTHPNLVPYSELSDTDKLKDAVFLSICNSMRYLQ